jgi:hypothetical protein
MRGREHHHHAEQHHMSSDPSRLLVMYLYCCLFPNLRSLDVEEVHVVRSSVHNGPQQDAICNLPVEPLTFIKRQPSNLWPDDLENVSTHG